MKKILSLLLAITLLFTLGGCFNSNEDNITHEDVKNRVIDEATEYLKKTYPNDEFTYISGRSPNWAYPYYEIGFSSKNYDNQLVTVYGDPDDEANTEDGLTVYNYYDDYYQYYMLEDAEEYFYNLAKPYLGNQLVIKTNISSGIGFAKSIKRGQNFVKNLEDDAVNISLYIFHNKTINNDKFKRFLNSLIEKKIYISVTLLETERLEELSNKKMSDILGDLFGYYTDRKFYTTFDGVINEY